MPLEKVMGLVRFLVLLALACCALVPNRCVAAYAFLKVADKSSAAPSGNFSDFGVYPAIHGGNVAFSGRYAGVSGIFRGEGGAVTTIARYDDPIGTRTIRTFSEPAISGDLVTFRGDLRSAGGTFTSGILKGSGGALASVAQSADVGPEGSFGAFFDPSFYGDTIAFKARFLGSGPAGVGIFTETLGHFATIARDGDAAPSGTFTDFENPMIGSGGRVAFTGRYGADAGVFAAGDEELVTIAKGGDPAPVGTFFPLAFLTASPTISGESVAMKAFYPGNHEGLFLGSGAELSTIVKTGDPAPSGTFQTFSPPTIAGDTVAFGASYLGGSGLFTARGGVLQSVLKLGDSLFGGTVTVINFGRFGIDPDGSGNLTFQYSLSNGQRGIAKAVNLSADFNFDTRVDGEDLGNWRNGFATGGVATQLQGDADGDHDVDGDDLLAWQRQLGSSATPPIPGFAVPEPSSARILFGLIGGVLAWQCRSRSRRRLA